MLPTIIGATVIAVLFAAVIYSEIKKRKNGGGCGCGCGGCSGCAQQKNCSDEKKDNK